MVITTSILLNGLVRWLQRKV